MGLHFRRHSTKNGAEPLELAKIDFKIDKVAPAADGLLPFVPENDEEKSKEPGAYMEEINDYFNAEHISDGLPIIPPTKARYEKMLAYCPSPEDMVLTDPVRAVRQVGNCKRRGDSRGNGGVQAHGDAHTGWRPSRH